MSFSNNLKGQTWNLQLVQMCAVNEKPTISFKSSSYLSRIIYSWYGCFHGDWGKIVDFHEWHTNEQVLNFINHPLDQKSYYHIQPIQIINLFHCHGNFIYTDQRKALKSYHFLSIFKCRLTKTDLFTLKNRLMVQI